MSNFHRKPVNPQPPARLAARRALRLTGSYSLPERLAQDGNVRVCMRRQRRRCFKRFCEVMSWILSELI